MITVGTPGLGVRHPDGVLFVFIRMENRRIGHHAGGGRPDRASLQWMKNPPVDENHPVNETQQESLFPKSLANPRFK
jgi:hypothetical protein